ncbi:hypothetical protein SK128_023379, partial [Halocaridina rubra]
LNFHNRIVMASRIIILQICLDARLDCKRSLTPEWFAFFAPRVNYRLNLVSVKATE